MNIHIIIKIDIIKIQGKTKEKTNLILKIMRKKLKQMLELNLIKNMGKNHLQEQFTHQT